MDFGIEIDGDRLVALRFEQFPERARAAIANRLGSITQRLLARVQGTEPSRTGRLRSETQSSVAARGDRISGRVFVDASRGGEGEHGKAGALEYGAHGTAHVGAHAMQLSHIYNEMMEPREVLVAAYDRRVNIAERRFLRGPLDEMRSEIIEELRQALAEVAAE